MVAAWFRAALALTAFVTSSTAAGSAIRSVTSHPRLAPAPEAQASQVSPDCSKDDSGTVIEGRNPNRECRLPTGITVRDESGRGYVVTIRVASAEPSASVGLAFAVTDPDSSGYRRAYVFAVRQDGAYLLSHSASGKETRLIDWSTSPAIKTGTGVDHELMVLTTEGVIRCFVNGRYVGGHRLTTSLAGGISFYTAGVVKATFNPFLMRDDPKTPLGTPMPGRVVVSDDMVSRRNFQVGGSQVCRASYNPDGYLVENLAMSGLCDLPLLSLGTFGHQVRIELDAKLRTGPLNHSFGVFFGWLVGNPHPMYAGLIDGQGTFQIIRRQGQWQRLTRLLRHDSVRTGRDVWNHLTIEIRDQTIRGYVNGVLVGRADATSAVEGSIGLYVNAPGMAVVFRNLTVAEL